MQTLKIKSNSTPNKVAGAIAGELKTNGVVELVAVGPNPVNQAVKGIACAHGFATTDGYDFVCVPDFCDIEIEGKKRTAIKFTVTKTK